MNRILLLLGCMSFIGSYGCQQHRSMVDSSIEPTAVYHINLFPITENDRVGYIDSTGKVIIPPRFRSAGEFSESLAPARIDGDYGFIDSTGEFVIQPQFDYAEPMHHGIARVYKFGVSRTIKIQGKDFQYIPYVFIEDFHRGLVRIVNGIDRMGVVNMSGEIVIDTVFRSISPFSEGFAVVNGLQEGETGIIDSTGHWLVPFGRYRQIDACSDGHFKVWLRPDSVNSTQEISGFVDRHGTLLSYIDVRTKSIWGNLHNGVALSCWHKDGEFMSSVDARFQYITPTSKVAFRDSCFVKATDFSDNRAFVQYEGDANYSLITTTGKTLISNQYKNVHPKGFSKGKAFVLNTELWGLLDTNAHWQIEPQYDKIDPVGIRNNEYFFYANRPRRYTNGAYSQQEELWGIATKEGKIMLQACMRDYNPQGFQGGLLRCHINSTLCYINKSGKIVWQEKADSTTRIEAMNVDYMTATGYYPSLPKSNSIIESIVPSQDTTLYLRLSAINSVRYNEHYKANVLRVINNSSSIYRFPTQNGQLDMQMVAQDESGLWRDIEYFGDGECGVRRSYSLLPSGRHWNFILPRFNGAMKTKLRVQIRYFANGKEKILYSNSITASINASQFWRNTNILFSISSQQSYVYRD